MYQKSNIPGPIVDFGTCLSGGLSAFLIGRVAPPKARRGLTRAFVFGLALGFTLSLSVALNLQGALAQEVQPSAGRLNAFQNCLNGEVSQDEAKTIGQEIGSRGNELTFDSSVFSSGCANEILPFLSSTYSEAVSLQLIKFFWRPEYLERLYKLSVDEPRKLKCDLLCFLSIERRELPDLSIFRMLEAQPMSQSIDAQALLLARAMLVSPELDLTQAGALIAGLPQQDMQERVVISLYLLGSAPFLRSHYHYSSNAVCLSNLCATMADVIDNLDCPTFHQMLSGARSVEALVGLKRWVMTNGKSQIEACVINELKAPYDAHRASILADLYRLLIFNASLGLPDLENNARGGVFLNFSFLDSDISKLDNIDLSKLRSLTSSFSRRIADQMRANTTSTFLSRAQASSSFDLTALFGQETALLRYLSCEASRNKTADACDVRAIYLAEISHSLRLREDAK